MRKSYMTIILLSTILLTNSCYQKESIPYYKDTQNNDVADKSSIVNLSIKEHNINYWDWDSWDNCHGIEKIEECNSIKWPINYGCRTANKDNCYECIAEKNNDPSICEKITSENKNNESFLKDNCYWWLVIKLQKNNKLNKINFCNKFYDEAHKKACYEIIN